MNSKNQAPVLSFILPLYNVSLYLAKCLDSILCQTETNFEIIVIDDGSTDMSLEICRRFASIDKRIRVYSQENQGQGAARNLGITLAKGEFIAFVDPDDFLDARMMEISLRKLRGTSADFVSFRIQFVHENEKLGYSMPRYRHSNLNDQDIFKHALIDDQIYSSPCNKVYRKDFLIKHAIRFPVVRSYEDLIFSRVVACKSKKCIFTNEILYYALIRAGSTSRSINEEYFHLAVRVIDLEKYVLSISESQNDIQIIFSAHVRKFLSAVILKAAFILNSKILFIQYAAILNSTIRDYPLNLKIFKRLGLRARVSILISISPKVSWEICRVLKILGYKTY